MNHITYLLGAGASYNAIPILDTLSKSILDFLDRLDTIYGSDQDISFQIRENWIPLINLAAQHTSIDTFAKKLFITGDADRLWRLKLILSAYFLYEQSYDEDAFVSHIVQRISQYSKFPIDPRYDFFMAAMLKLREGKPELPSNLKIVSWNYDSQIEMAFHPYSKINHNDDKSLHDYLRLHPKCDFEYSKNENVNLDDIKIVKLNGTAANLYAEKMNSFEVQGYRKLMFEEALAQIKLLVQTSTQSRNLPDYIGYGSNINFAWELEGNWFSKIAVEAARTIISRSRALVVIGYSFPIFNRDIDKYIFKDNILEKVYIQDVPKNIEGVLSRASRIMDADIEIFELIPNVDQFFVPFEL